MGFLAAQSPVVVVGDLRVDGDPDICQVLHQAVGLGFADHKAALLDRRSAGRSCGKRLNALADQRDVPAGIFAGLLEKSRVVCIEPE